MATMTFTDALLRSYLGPNGGLQPPDAPPPAPPAPPIEIDYPHISTRPEYKAALDKLNNFAKLKDEAEAILASLYEQIQERAKYRAPTTEDVIAKAEALLAGDGQEPSLQAEYQATNKRIAVLREAIEAQHNALRLVIADLSRAAGRRYEDEHKKRVKRMMAAVDELNAANRYEQALHGDLSRLGYTGTALPAMNLLSVQDPNEVCGNLTYYWYRNAADYSQSAEEVAAALRKRRLQAALAT